MCSLQSKYDQMCDAVATELSHSLAFEYPFLLQSHVMHLTYCGHMQKAMPLDDSQEAMHTAALVNALSDAIHILLEDRSTCSCA